MTQQDRIEGKVDKILKQQAETSTQIALITERCKARKETLDALRETVKGNGKAGLEQTVHDHDKALERIADVGKFSRPIVQRLITVAMVAIMAGAWTVYQDHRLEKFAEHITVQTDPNATP